MKAWNSPPFGLRLRLDFGAFAQDSLGRRPEHRATRGVEAGGVRKDVRRRRMMNERAALMSNAG